MKRMIPVVVCALMLASVAYGQKPVRFLAGVGIGLPTGDLSNGWNLGFHGRFNVVIESSPGFTIEPNFQFDLFPLDKQGISGLSGGGVHALIFGADFRYLFPSSSPTRFFVVGGAGIAAWGISDLRYQGDLEVAGDSETKPSFSFGWGIMFGSSPTMKYFVEMRYSTILSSGSDVTWVPITFGLKF